MQVIANMVSRISIYRLKLRTGSDDEQALLLLADNKLVAILVELADECHGDERGKWMVEKIFGLGDARVPDVFDSAEAAAAWVGDHICSQKFALDGEIKELV